MTFLAPRNGDAYEMIERVPYWSGIVYVRIGDAYEIIE